MTRESDFERVFVLKPRFESKLLDTASQDWFTELEELGDDGWDAVTSVPTEQRDLPWLLLKRDVPGGR